ncbi:MAG: hypothetical protein QF441_08090 [Bacteriovoracaceae bacterium]|jgi:hypothetical protein|nr:hypothetical protein [Bacteriovoracaceae bacterium]
MSQDVEKRFNGYPNHVRPQMLELRNLILEIAINDNEIDFKEESLKWGEPSFVTNSSGSTLRIDWKKKHDDKISLYVNCNTKLISIFKELYPDDFEYVGNRELQIPLNGKYSKIKLSKCIEMVLKYNLIKDKF